LKADYSDLTVITPTLNEKNNIVRLVGALDRMYRNVSVIVADDGSRDGTREAVSALGKKNGRVRLLDRSRKSVHGLTASVLDAALMARTRKIVVMDGDMQHPPAKVGDIAKALDSYDLVVGVRSRIKDWGIHRKIMSKGMAYLAYLMFAARNKKRCNDMMSGFFGIDAGLFRGLIKRDRDRFVERGYKVLLDILKLMDSKSSIGEVRYPTFHLRKEGSSKFRFRHVITTLDSVLR
jgi:dolichol-phosphate mannosyltransferase